MTHPESRPYPDAARHAAVGGDGAAQSARAGAGSSRRNGENGTPGEQRFRCLVIGDGAFPIACAEALRERGHTLCGVLSADPAVLRWAGEQGVPAAGSGGGVAAFVSGARPDWMFSVMNGTVLTGDVLALPRLGAINYHPAPLPRYAGRNPAVWAVMQREPAFGITWHRMAERVDAGGILLQREVEVLPDDTGVSLTARCHQVALEAFGTLLDDLAAGRAQPLPQQLQERTYFGRWHRAPDAGLVCWEKGAEEIGALVRALHFGAFENPIGTARVALGGQLFAVAGLAPAGTPSAAPPGTITAVEGDALRVATGEGEVLLRALRTLDGQPRSPAGEAARLGLRTGGRMPSPSAQARERMGAADRALARHEPSWVERLASLAPAELPWGRPAVAADAGGGTRRTPLPLSGDALGALAAATGATVSEVVLAAFTSWLARAGGRDVFDLGYRGPALRAAAAGAEALVAPRVPLRIAAEEGASFTAHLAAVRGAVAGAEARTGHLRDLPLRYPELRDAGLRALPVAVETGGAEDAAGHAANAPGEILALVVPEAGAPFLRWDAGALAEEDAARTADALATWVQALAAAPERPLERVSLLSAKERARVVEEWNATDAAYPAFSCLHELFEAQVARTPDAPALAFEDRTLTYAELNARANRLAHHLRGRGVGPDARVGLCVERSLEMMVALLAVLKAGGAYVAMDPEYPDDRLRYILDDSAPVVVLAYGSRAERFGWGGVPVVALEGDAPAWARLPETNPGRAGLTPDHLAYLIYTSGSTGRPKGVMVAHRSVVNVLTWMQEGWKLGADDVVLQKTPYSFDASLRELIPPLLAGARLVMARPGGQRDPGYMLETIRREGITTLHFVPSMLQALVGEPDFARLPALRQVVCGGEPMPADLVRRFCRQAPRTRLYNVYGPTEAAVDVTAWSCVRGEGTGSVPIGRPMANTRIYVLDRAGEPLPQGVAGELYIGGVQVARGYRSQPGLTAARYVPDPFASTGGARMYRTGDLGRWLADGSLEVLGRTDFQVKVRGFRIELGEIEAVLAEHRAVQEAVVAGRDDGAGERRLVAYYVAAAEGVSADTLRGHLAQRLPEYMVPAAYVRMDRFPATLNGKLDRKALPAPDAGAYARSAWEPPAGATEEVLAGIWAELLRVEQVSALDTFFGLGGHSLLATRMAFQVSKAVSAHLPLAGFFEPWNLRRLARWADEHRAEESGDGAPPLVRVPRGERLPLTLLQEFSWMGQQMNPGLTSGNTPHAVRLRGHLDVPALERTLAEVVRRHEALRTTFAAPRGVPEQVVSEPGPVRIPVVDLADLHPATRGAEALRIARAEAAHPFDLQRGPLLRTTLLRLGAREWVLLVTVHHIVSDGWSRDVILRELSALYRAFVAGDAAPALPEPEVQYADYAVWQRGWMQGEVLERHATYWRQRLTGAHPLDLAGEGAARGRRSPRRTLDFQTSSAPLEALRRLGAGEGATLFMVLLAAFKVLLVRYTGQPDVTLETPLAGRSHPELAGTVGFFALMGLLRTNLSGDPTFREALVRVRETTLGAYDHQELPLFERLGSGAAWEAAVYQRLRRMSFSFQDTLTDSLVLQGLHVEGLARPAPRPGGMDDLSLLVSGGVLRGAFTYRVEVFPEAVADQAVRHLLAVLDQVAADPELRISQLVLAGPPSAAVGAPEPAAARAL